jgi:hypothetical protein
MSKTKEQHQSSSRLGALGESIVKTFLLEWCDFVYDTMPKHPADLLCELGPAKYTIQVKSRNKTQEGKYVYATESSRTQSKVYQQYHCDIIAFVFMPDKRILFKPNNSTQTYFTFHSDIITPDLEIDSFKETLDVLSQVPTLNPLLDEADN